MVPAGCGETAVRALDDAGITTQDLIKTKKKNGSFSYQKRENRQGGKSPSGGRGQILPLKRSSTSEKVIRKKVRDRGGAGARRRERK